MNAPSNKQQVVPAQPERRFELLTLDQRIDVLESTIYPGADKKSIALVIAACEAQGLDAMSKPFHIVPMTVKVKKDDGGFAYKKRDVVMQGIELYRTKAARTGVYAGMDSAEWGADVTETLGGEDKVEWDEQARKRIVVGKWPTKQITYPLWCEVTVYRLIAGQRCPFPSGRVYWRETYATAGRDTSLPNEMWEKRTRGQLEKCAEAMALRRAFPEIGAQPTMEEMIGRVIEHDTGAPVPDEPPPPRVEQPKSKSEARAEPKVVEGEVVTEEPTGSQKPKKTGNGDFKSALRPSQITIIRKKLQLAALSELDLEAAFPGKSLEPKADFVLFDASEANAILEWIDANRKG
jgi:phage recombination protein Bet